MDQRFRTKTGHVDVTADALVIERTGLRGAMAEALHGRRSTTRTWLVYGFVCALLAGLAWTDWQAGETLIAALEASGAGAIALMLLSSRNFSMTPVVPRADTSRIETIRGWPGITRDRLVAHLVDNGQPRRRFIQMPGLLQRRAGELDRAVALLRTHGWPVD